MFTNARNPRWTGANHQTILFEVEMEGGWVGFVASPNDCTEYGPLLYNLAVNGIFGTIAASDEERILAGDLPVPDGYTIQDGRLICVADYEQPAMEELNRRLTELQTPEALALAEIDAGYATERLAKLAALLAVKEQLGWPVTVEWPA